MLPELDTCAAEAVLAGHPDKMCDQIADALLDQYLTTDADAKVAIECLGSGSTFIVAGEVSSTSSVDIVGVVNRVYREIGYSDELHVVKLIQSQSEQLQRPLLVGAANDQTVVYGFACQNDFNFLPRPVFLANALAKSIDALRHRLQSHLPDGKVLVCTRDGSVHALFLSVQHSADANRAVLRDLVTSAAVNPVVPVNTIHRLYFNHNSDFLSGGFANDTGLTGRKLASDTYGGLIPNGGGSFSGKDPSKIDRTGAYMARFVAKCLVAGGLSERCLVSVAYAFGVEQPVLVVIRTGDAQRDKRLMSIVHERFDLRTSAIIERFALKRPIYRRTSTYGHFSDPDYPWERTVDL